MTTPPDESELARLEKKAKRAAEDGWWIYDSGCNAVIPLDVSESIISLVAEVWRLRAELSERPPRFTPASPMDPDAIHTSVNGNPVSMKRPK